MTKAKKIAQGAIRERKARKERAHEQDKPKRCKRWLSRLLALFGCLLLVSALVVPCFADSPEELADSGEREVNFLEVLSSFRDTMTTDDKSLMIDPFTDSLGSGFFDYSYFNGGNIALTLTSWFNYDAAVTTREVLEDVYVSILVNGLSIDIPSGRELSRCTVFYDFSISPDENRSSLLLTFRSTEDAYTGTICQIQYLGTVSGGSSSGYTANLYLSGVTSDYFDTAFDIEDDVLSVGFLADYYSPGISLQQQLSLLNSLFSNANSNEPSNPHEFYQGFLGGDYYGYGDGYDAGYDVGYDAGHLIGYESGFRAGQKATDLWQSGYDQAVSEIDSDDFGRNFLGGLFSAPAEAMKAFTIVEWTTESGAHISITLMTLFGAIVGVFIFVWFLKMFAGG